MPRLVATNKPSSSNSTSKAKVLATQQSLDAVIWAVCDIMRRSNCASALQYVPELTWLLFLRILDEREDEEAEQAEAVGQPYTPSLQAPYRWRDWAAPAGAKRSELQHGAMNAFFGFVNGDLLPHLKGLRDRPNATPRQKVISETLSGVEHVRVDTERNLLDILDKLDQVRINAVDQTHIFTLSQVYEGLLLRMGEKNNDGGQFFTPREVIRALVQVIDPQIGETVYDPCCGTGGFLAQAYDHMRPHADTAEQIEALKQRTFYGREKENLIYPIALSNLVLHGIDSPHLWHGNTLSGGETYGGLFAGAPPTFDVVLTNPPFGGKEGPEAQTHFAYKTSATQVLFLQHVVNALKRGGRCGIVLDEGVLFRTNEAGFVGAKRMLLDQCDLWALVSLPPNVFAAAGGGVKTNLLFFTKGQPTKQVWYYDLSQVKVTKTQPLTLAHFEECFRLLPARAESAHSWTVPVEAIKQSNYDLKAVNPNAKTDGDTRTPEELLDLIEAKGREVAEALAALRSLSPVARQSHRSMPDGSL